MENPIDKDAHLTEPHQYTLATERLVMRPLTPPDAPRLAVLGNDEEIASVTRSIKYPFTQTDAAKWIETKQSDPNGFSFGIYLRAEDLLIGQIGLLAIEWENSQAELGFFVGRDYWGNGYVTEAARALLKFGFEQVGFNRITAHHLVRNPASGAVLKKIGMKTEGVLRQRIRKNDVFEDVITYAILKSD